MSTVQIMSGIGVLVPYAVGVEPLSKLPGVTVIRYEPGEALPADAATAQVFIPPFLASAEAVSLVHELPALRLVQLLTAGAEAWSDVPDGVLVANCRGAHSGATAEWILAALLSVYRHFPRFLRAQDAGTWDYHVTEELAGKRVLIVGAGDVAAQTVRRLEAFDVATALVGRTARAGVHGIDEVHDLLPRFDACVVIIPLTGETRGLVDEAFLAAMPDGAVLVNAARGPVADTEALLAELTSGRLRAALDVTDPEPLPPGHPLWAAPGLLLAPHVGGSVPLAFPRAFAVAAEQIAAFARGETPPNVV